MSPQRSRVSLAVFGCLVALVVLVAVFGPALAPYDPYETDYALSLAAPDAAHPFGCDALGRDVFSRVVYAARTSVLMSLFAVAVPLAVGVAVGVAAGYAGGWVDSLLMRVTDMFQAFPELILGVAVVGILGPGMANAIVAVVAVTWIRYARLARSLVVSMREEGFVATARMSGEGPVGIVVRHLLPNMATQVIAMGALDISYVMLTLASFSFLGLGVQPPTPEWGSMLSEGRTYFASAPHLMLFPGMAVFVTVAVFNLFGNAVSECIGAPRDRSLMGQRTGGTRERTVS